MLELVLYGRPACHLCDEMADELQKMLAGRDIRLRVEDVDTNPQWRERYGTRVPVLATVAGDEICHYRLDAAVVRKLAKS